MVQFPGHQDFGQQYSDQIEPTDAKRRACNTIIKDKFDTVQSNDLLHLWLALRDYRWQFLKALGTQISISKFRIRFLQRPIARQK